MKNANQEPDTLREPGAPIRFYSRSEKDAAVDFAKFLYDLWYERIGHEIIDLDKTIYSDEEPTSVN